MCKATEGRKRRLLLDVCVTAMKEFAEVTGLLGSCPVPGTVLSAEDLVPAFKDSGGAVR